MEIRKPASGELQQASALCMRSKAYWGYDDDFMAACEAELTLTLKDLEDEELFVATDGTGMAGVLQVSYERAECFLEKLFVDPSRMGEGVGRKLFEHALSTAQELGASEMVVEADPGAVPFYRRMGCVDAGTAPSGSIAGRQLPRLTYALAK